MENIARNVHETWAKQRIADGWKYGPVRNDATKEHPCLVPYDELDESEKVYDRTTAGQTLKLIMKLGFTNRLDICTPLPFSSSSFRHKQINARHCFCFAG